MNKLDKQILYELSKNSREFYSKIGKKLKRSKQTVKNRIDKLVKDQVISYFFTIINQKNFGIKPLHIFISLNKTTPQMYKEIVSYLVNNIEQGSVEI